MKRRTIAGHGAPLVAGAIALLASAPAAPADLTPLPLDRLLQMRVVAASSYEQDAREAPSAVSVITAEDIRLHGYRTLGEALASIPGLYLTNDLSYGYLGSRGFNRLGDYNSRFQLSVNGVRTNDALFDMAYLGTEFPLDMALIERIEFAPGPGSSIYGSNAVLGVINVVTRRASSHPGPRVDAAVASHGERELAVGFGHVFENGAEVLASVSGLRSAGPTHEFRDLGLSLSGKNGERYRRGYLRATYGDFDLEVLGGQRDKDAPAVFRDSDPDRAQKLLDRIGHVALRYRREVAEGTVLEARASAGSYEYTGIYPLAVGGDGRDDFTGRWFGSELRIVSTHWANHKVVAGLEMQSDARLDQRYSESDYVYVDRSDEGRRSALYVQDEFRFSEDWRLDLGLRRDEHNSFGASTNPRVALIGDIAADVTLKALYGSAFRAPNVFEMYYDTGSASPALRPERLRSAELVLEGQSGERSRWRASLFRYKFTDLIEQVELDGGNFGFNNAGAATGRGAEISATSLLPGSARLDLGASFADVRDGAGARLTNSPRYTARASLAVPLASGSVRAAFDLGVVGPRLDRDRATVPANVVGNVVLGTMRSWQGFLFTLGIYNVTDRRNMQPVNDYFAVAQVPAPGRSVRIQAQWRY